MLSLDFFFTDPATTEIYTLSLHDALPISLWSSTTRRTLTRRSRWWRARCGGSMTSAARPGTAVRWLQGVRSEEHTSELQSQSNLVCRLLLEKKKEQHGPPHRHARRAPLCD